MDALGGLAALRSSRRAEALAGPADKVAIMFALAFIWAPPWGNRTRVAALAVCVLLGLAPGRGFAQEGGDVAARVGKLEAEIADLKAMVAELEALVRAKPSLTPEASSAGPAGEGDLGPRVSALETQIGALTNQIELMRGQVNGTGAAPTPRADVEGEAVTPPMPKPDVKPDIMEALRDAPPTQVAPVAPPAAIPQAVDESDPSKPRWYGARPGQETVDDGAPQSIMPPSAATGAVPDALSRSLAALPNSNAEALYEQAYGDLLQRDYPAAETGFAKVVKDYPDDPLAGSAQYWVGETYYVRKQYKKAADSFLTAYRKYTSSDKAPDSLLRLGMSLAALGQKDAACSTFKELHDKFPDVHDHIRNQAKGEAAKAGCK